MDSAKDSEDYSHHIWTWTWALWVMDIEDHWLILPRKAPGSLASSWRGWHLVRARLEINAFPTLIDIWSILWSKSGTNVVKSWVFIVRCCLPRVLQIRFLRSLVLYRFLIPKYGCPEPEESGTAVSFCASISVPHIAVRCWNDYTTWKVDGATPMYWLSWPLTKPPFGSCAIYFHYGVESRSCSLNTFHCVRLRPFPMKAVLDPPILWGTGERRLQNSRLCLRYRATSSLILKPNV